MEKLMIAAFLLLPFSSFGQVDTKSTEPQSIGMELRPHEKMTFFIKINKPKHKFSFEQDGTILYSQTQYLGRFEFINKDGYSSIGYYDEVDGKKLTKMIINPGTDTTTITFGDNDVEVKFISELLPENLDIKNKNFVRFMCYASSVFLCSDYAISIKNILPPNSYTEPGSEGMIQKEYNSVVDSNIYLIFKNYILSQKLSSKRKKTKQVNKFNMVIDVDFKHRYQFNNQQTIIFLSKFIAYLKTKNIEYSYLEQILAMEYHAEESFKDKTPLSADPN